MTDQELSCTQPARGPLTAPLAADPAVPTPQEETVMIQARVGRPAPDFEAMAYQDGAFKLVKLSDWQGQWRLVCFYPGDFTFV